VASWSQPLKPQAYVDVVWQRRACSGEQRLQEGPQPLPYSQHSLGMTQSLPPPPRGQAKLSTASHSQPAPEESRKDVSASELCNCWDLLLPPASAWLAALGGAPWMPQPEQELGHS
jgi:hypothetical protein